MVSKICLCKAKYAYAKQNMLMQSKICLTKSKLNCSAQAIHLAPNFLLKLC